MLCGTRWAFDVFSAISPPILPVMHLCLRRDVDRDCKRRLRVGAACLRSARRCGRRSFLESSVTTKAQALHDDPEPNRPRRECRRCAVVYSALRTLERISRLAYLSFSFRVYILRNCKRRLIFSNRREGSDWRHCVCFSRAVPT